MSALQAAGTRIHHTIGNHELSAPALVSPPMSHHPTHALPATTLTALTSSATSSCHPASLSPTPLTLTTITSPHARAGAASFSTPTTSPDRTAAPQVSVSQGRQRTCCEQFATCRRTLLPSDFFQLLLCTRCPHACISAAISPPQHCFTGSPQSDQARALIRAHNPNPSAWDSSVQGNFFLGMAPGDSREFAP